MYTVLITSVILLVSLSAVPLAAADGGHPSSEPHADLSVGNATAPLTDCERATGDSEVWSNLVSRSARIPVAGEPVTFGANESAFEKLTCAPASNITEVRWRFGENTVKTGTSVTHTFESSGEFSFAYNITYVGQFGNELHIGTEVRGFDVANGSGDTDSGDDDSVGDTGPDDRDGSDSETVSAPVVRSFTNGTVYQTGRVSSSPEALTAGRQVTVTGEVTSHHPSAANNDIYIVLGLADTTVLDITEMDGTGSGTVTTTATIPADAAGETLVWTFYAADTAEDARQTFEAEARTTSYTSSDGAEVLGTVSDDNKRPVPAITVKSTRGEVDLSASASTDDGSIESYEWIFGDGSTATGETVEHEYDEAGEYTVSLTVTDDRGVTNSTTKTVESLGDWARDAGANADLTVAGPGHLNITAGHCSGISAWKTYGDYQGPVTVEFDYTATIDSPAQRLEARLFHGGGLSSFEVGADGSKQGRFSRTVRADGNVRLNFVLEGGCDSSNSETRYGITDIEVTETASVDPSERPTARFTVSDRNPAAGTEITMDADTSTATSPIDRYEWQFGDGQSETGLTADHTYDEAGRYQVTLTTIDEGGLSDTTTQWIEIDPSETTTDSQQSGKPDLRSIAYGQTKTGHVDGSDPRNRSYLEEYFYEPVTFEGSSGDIVSVDVAPAGGGQTSVRVWGPSGSMVATGELSLFELPADGTYTLKIGFAWEKFGAYDLSLTRHNDDIPRASIEVGTDNVVVGTEATFDAAVSDDGSIDAHEWSFGDGATATGDSVTHTYEQNGTYTVTLTVTDDEGFSDTVSTTVDVESVVEDKYDTDDDGIELSELRQAREDATDSSSDIDIENVRQLIEEYSGDRSTSPPDDQSDTGTDTGDNDGLPPMLEIRGVPVLNTFKLGKDGDDANLTDNRGGDLPVVIKRIKTDPSSADTDGDGLEDGFEVGSKRTLPGTNQPVYELKSDPTDANTDDAGVDDKEEFKKDSNPKDPEHFSINVVLPVVGEEGCDPGDGANTRNCAEVVYGNDEDAAYGIKAVQQFNYDNEEVGIKSIPSWLSNLEDDPGETRVKPGYTYYLVEARIKSTTSGDHYGKLPEEIQFTGFTGRSATVVGVGNTPEVEDGWAFDPFPESEGGFSGTTKTAYIAVRSKESRNVDAPLYRNLGRLEVTMEVPKGPYARGSFSGSVERDVITSAHRFGVNDSVPATSKSEARAMVKRATKQFGQLAVATGYAVTGGALGAAKLSVLKGARTGTLLVAEGIATLTGIDEGGDTSIGPDDVVGKLMISEGAVPSYLENSGDGSPSANIVITTYRAN